MPEQSPTVVAMLTPPGRAAVAVAAVEGPRSLEMVDQYFRPHRGVGLVQRKINQIAYGRWGAEPAEDVIALRKSDTRIEVHCHGGAAAVRRIVENLIAAGAVETSWPDLVARDDGNSIQSAARIALAEAPTLKTAAILLDQYQGAFEREIKSILDLLDQSQCGGPKSTEASCQEQARLGALISRSSIGLHLTRPWRVIIAGPPNVGKSTLMNALLGYDRAIVFDRPGTTRDVVTAVTALDGWPVELSDTAGLRSSDDPLEAAGVERANSQAATADCLLLVFDASQNWTIHERKLVDCWPAAMVVHNKSDLSPLQTPAPAGMNVSAKTGAGLEALVAAIVKTLVAIELPSGTAVPFTVEQVSALRAAEVAVRDGQITKAKAALLALLS